MRAPAGQISGWLAASQLARTWLTAPNQAMADDAVPSLITALIPRHGRHARRSLPGPAVAPLLPAGAPGQPGGVAPLDTDPAPQQDEFRPPPVTSVGPPWDQCPSRLTRPVDLSAVVPARAGHRIPGLPAGRRCYRCPVHGACYRAAPVSR
jgi:hypothetical protein